MVVQEPRRTVTVVSAWKRERLHFFFRGENNGFRGKNRKNIRHEMSTPGKAGTVFPAARIVANPFATGIIVDAGALSSRAPGIQWNEPQSLGLDVLDENASIASQIPSAAVTPGKSILKTPRGKNQGGQLRSNDYNSGGGGGLGTPVRTPGKTPGGSSSIRSLALSKTPGGADTPFANAVQRTRALTFCFFYTFSTQVQSADCT